MSTAGATEIAAFVWAIEILPRPYHHEEWEHRLMPALHMLQPARNRQFAVGQPRRLRLITNDKETSDNRRSGLIVGRRVPAFGVLVRSGLLRWLQLVPVDSANTRQGPHPDEFTSSRRLDH
jgi:hypothetical protein